MEPQRQRRSMAPAAPLLPLEILQKIGLWIHDSDGFFAFLSALGSAEARGSLESLWQLGLVHDRAHLWPTLKLSHGLLTAPARRTCVEEAMQHCAVVEVVQWLNDLHWLRRHVGRSTIIEWTAPVPPSFDGSISPADWVDSWTQIPLKTLMLTCNPFRQSSLMPLLLAALPRFVETLCCLHSNGHADVVLEFAATSTTLVQLKLHCLPGSVTTTMLQHATQWLESAPVRSFHFHMGRQQFGFSDIAESFFSTLFHCQTLVQLTLASCDLFQLGAILPVAFPSTLQSLTLDACGLSPSCLIQLGRCVRPSALRKLRLCRVNYNGVLIHDYVDAFAHLLAGVAHSSLTSLTLGDCRLDDSSWRRLGRLLAQSKLERVTLLRNGIGDTGAKWLAHAIQANATIKSLDLEFNQLTAEGVTTLLDVNLHRDILPLEELVVSLKSPDNATVHCDTSLDELFELCKSPERIQFELLDLAKERGVNLAIK
ncbi:Aste57867_1071 [Aphanomyces stellatus]|uniref:Aste57867_1071 protein n=1 Tax=Aphanomyces stellatus TaxID=120398 RepID=A0A485K7L6_9STRA|nr:hypothetical protein As57867_001070 [Aphanomyces stellatus]VFT78293.1 Aste57867_1071 [Aphanomyces stellatus]